MKTKHILIVLLFIVFITSETVLAKSDTKENIPVVYNGWSSAYDKIPTDHTLEYRLEIGDIQEGFDTYVAVPECNRIGETGIIIFSDGSQNSYQVFDCASRNHSKDNSYKWMTENNIIVELDFYTWEDKGLGRVTLIVD